jgi:hypothetical protein
MNTTKNGDELGIDSTSDFQNILDHDHVVVVLLFSPYLYFW